MITTRVVETKKGALPAHDNRVGRWAFKRRIVRLYLARPCFICGWRGACKHREMECIVATIDAMLVRKPAARAATELLPQERRRA